MSAGCAAVLRDVRCDGALHEAILDGAPANVVGIDTCRALVEAAHAAAGDPRCVLFVVRACGDHFSFGASIEEHLPDSAPDMLQALGLAVRTLASLPIPAVALVRGRCLGGGLEVALACGRILAEEGASFGAPEIRLGVFAPAATALLEGSLPHARAEDLLLTGRELSASEAESWGIVTRVVAMGGLEAALDDLAETLRRTTPLGVRAATRALRTGSARRLDARLAELERQYVEDIVRAPGGCAGIEGFLRKRAARQEARA